MAAPAPTEYTVTFDLNGISGTEPKAQEIEENNKVTKPADPTDEIHTFAGWYKTKDDTTGALSDPWDFDNDTVTADMTLYAQWTRTLESIYANSDIPKVTGNTAPDNAWVNGDGGKAFIAHSTSNAVLYLNGTKTISCKKTENFTKIGDDYVFSYGTQYGVFTLHMTEGKFTSVTYNGAGTDYEVLSGTYAPATTFKAVYNTEDYANTLTFYYDNKTYSGDYITVYDDLPTAATKAADWGYYDIRTSVKSVAIDSSVENYHGLTSTACMFEDMQYARSISGAEWLDVSNVTDMSNMFCNYGFEKQLTAVPDVSGWNTENVTDMSEMFFQYGGNSTALVDAPDVSAWNTASVTDVYHLFAEYGSSSSVLEFRLDLSGWNAGNLTSYDNMFTQLDNAYTWSVTIPATTGTTNNTTKKWYVGDGTDTEKFIIAPATNRQFTVATSAPASASPLRTAPLAGSEETPSVETASVETKAEGTVENVEAEKDLSIPVESLETEIPEAVVPEIAKEVKPEEAL